MKFLWFVTLLASIVGGLIFVLTLATSKGAPQEAAGYAMACAACIVPYVFTRAAQAIWRTDPGKHVDRIVAAIEKAKSDQP